MIKQHGKSETKHMRGFKQNAKNGENHADLLKQHDNATFLKLHQNDNISCNFTIDYIYSSDDLPLQGGLNQKRYDQNVEVNMNDRLRDYKKFLCGEHTKRKTIQQYFTSAKKFYTFCKGDINPQNMLEYKHHLNKIYAKHNSRRIRLHGANMFLRYLKYDELYQIPKEEMTNQQTITEEQIDTILDISKVNPELHLITMLLWDGCIRNGSIISIKISDRQGNRLNLPNTKTGDRHIIMSKNLQDAWNNYLIHRPTPKAECEDYLLIRTNGDNYKDTQHITDIIKKIGTVTGIPHKITPYTIRRTSATLRQNKFSKYFAGDPKIVQMMFNHTDIKTTMRYNQKTDNDIEQYLGAIYPDDIRPKTQDKSYLSAENSLKDCGENGEDNTSFSFSYFFSSIFCDPTVGVLPDERIINWMGEVIDCSFVPKTTEGFDEGGCNSHRSHLFMER